MVEEDVVAEVAGAPLPDPDDRGVQDTPLTPQNSVVIAITSMGRTLGTAWLH